MTFNSKTRELLFDINCQNQIVMDDIKIDNTIKYKMAVSIGEYGAQLNRPNWAV